MYIKSATMVYYHDTTIARMTIRRMLIERLYWVSFFFSCPNYKISQTKKAKVRKFKLLRSIFTDLEPVTGQEKFL